MVFDIESLEVLEKVKRGTPARFVLLTKGAKVVNLVAYRKGNVEAATRRAKTAGSGDISVGVIEGRGAILIFKLAKSDGYEAPPVRDAVLKEALGESEFNCRPTIQIVEVLPEVAMDDDVSPQPPTRPLPPVPQSGPPRFAFRTREDWETALTEIGAATDAETKTEQLTRAVNLLKAERTQVQSDAILLGDPNALREQNSLHMDVAEELKALHSRPLPRRPQPEPQPQVRGGGYRAQTEWDELLQAIGAAQDEQTKGRLLQQAAGELRAERERMQTDKLLAGDPNALREQNGIHVQVAQELKSLRERPLPQQPTRRQLPPQPIPRRLDPRGNVVFPPQQSQEDRDRQTLIADAKRRCQGMTGVEFPYNRTGVRKLLGECETDSQSDFGKVAAGMIIYNTDSYEIALARLQEAQAGATKYIKDHPDPKIGKLPSRVVLRRQNCKIFLQQIGPMLDQLRAEEEAGAAMAKTYQALLDRNQPIPYGVVDEIQDLLERVKLSAETTAQLRQIVTTIRDRDQPRGYDKIAQRQNLSNVEKAEIMLQHGCFTGTGGGTSDVRLLRNPDRSVLFAFKGAKGEAQGALDMLQLPPGASATREDLCSTLSQSILSQTGIDFGFPKAQAISLSGTTGALIEGIRGITVDPEEMVRLNGEQNPDPEQLNEVQRRLLEVPEKLTPQSLQKVLLFSTLSCQWDCKWGNMMVEGETSARPIDGGGSFPTQECIDDFGRDEKVKPLAILAFTEYPRHLSLGKKMGQTLPNAQVPMDPEVVRAVLAIDTNALANTLKTRRDQIARDIPELAPPPHEGGLVDDASIERVVTSIQKSQEILRANPQQTLVEFATAYQDWWLEYITANRRRNQ
ncbi:MAG: hypothetical protein SFU86_13525 [Pirellulaceae bacterium]|nr:hypothetical protein [Pirellulaceae bacterium]